MARLAGSVVPGDSIAGRLLRRALRGMALDQLLLPEPIDTRRYRAAIVDVVPSYPESPHPA